MKERIVLAILAATTASLITVAMLALLYARTTAEAALELRQTCSLCRDSLLQCTAKREQMESLLGMVASARREKAMGGP